MKLSAILRHHIAVESHLIDLQQQVDPLSTCSSNRGGSLNRQKAKWSLIRLHLEALAVNLSERLSPVS